MSDILNKILKHKYEQVPILKEAFNKGCFTKDGPLVVGKEKKRSLLKQLENSQHIQVIAEIKRGSPSKGLFAGGLDIEAQSKKYSESGAGAISVLTDKQFFYGGFTDLQTIRPCVSLPILCKDFIVDEVQIDIAKSLGADVILLIVSTHTPKRLKALLDYAHSKDLEVLMEVHNKVELEIALDLGNPIIGVNNRNLRTFKTDLSVSLDLIQWMDDPSIHMISESGIKTRADVELLAKAGFKGVLVGESLIRDGVRGSLINSLSSIVR